MPGHCHEEEKDLLVRFNFCDPFRDEMTAQANARMTLQAKHILIKCNNDIRRFSSLLDQAAMLEMYARISAFDNE